MDRLLYANMENGATSEYVTYRVNVNAIEHVFLEIGAENQRLQEVLPAQVYACGSNVFTSQMVQGVNNGTDRMFLVIRKNNQQYTVSPVTQASYYQMVNNRIQFESPRYSFNLDAQRGIIGENIATTRRSEMYFEGKLENDCTGAFLFTQRTTGEARPYTDMVFIPEIGISEVRNGQDATDALNHTLRLEKVNNYPVVDYLRLLCKRTQPTSTTQLTEKGGLIQEYDVTPKNPSNYNVSPRTQTPTPANYATIPTNRMASNPCGIEATNGYHVVTKGETLYRISKQYSVTVSQIQSWNNLGTSTSIGSCDRLRVAPTTPTQGVPIGIGQVVIGQGQYRSDFPYSVDNRPAVTQPAPYENTLINKGIQIQPQAQTIDNTTAAWKANQEYHVVARGETVASIALKYGFSEARLRDMNGLGKNEVVKIAQPLKVNDCAPNTSVQTTPTQYGNMGEFTSRSPYNFQSDERITPQFYQPSQTQLPRGTNGNVSPELARRMTTGGTDNTVPQTYDTNSNISFQGQRSLHLVKEGENLYQISRNYGVTVERLRQLNNLTANDVIIPFQRLYVN